MNKIPLVAAISLLSAVMPDIAPAAGQGLEDIRMSRSQGVATADVTLGCSMRYLNHGPSTGGAELTIRLGLGPDCNRLISGIHSELSRPQGRDMGGLQDVELTSISPGQATLTFRFYHPVGFSVSQGASLNGLRVRIETGSNKRAATPTAPPTPRPVTPAPQPPPPRTAQAPQEPSRPPLRMTPRFPSTNDLFVVQVTTLETGEAFNLDGLALPNDFVTYRDTVTAEGQKWQVMRVGFFTTEAEADAALHKLIRAQYPDAFVAVATPEEQTRAVPLGSQPAKGLPTATAAAEGDATLDAERVEELVAEGKEALRDGNVARAIKVYSRVLEEPPGDETESLRQEAREYLGLARERNGQTAHARAEYEAFLAQYPDHPSAGRVRQRLAGLLEPSGDDKPVQPLAKRTPRGRWDFFAGFSQFYRRDVNQLIEDGDEIVSQSAVLSRADFLARREGDRFDVLGRINAGYHYDMLDEQDSIGDQGQVSYAYVDVTDQKLDLYGRIGRQSSYRGGVLGRFDGLHVSYRYKPDIALNVTTGFPVDSPRYVMNTDRSFYGASVDFENVAKMWDFSVFANLQSIDGISDREAVGAEAVMRRGNWNLVSMMDLDVSYEVLNSFLFAANWIATDKITFNGRFDLKAFPFLTSRNALIGQPVSTIDELLLNYSEGQIRTLARNRTADAASASFGISAALTPRLQLNADVNFSQIEGTVASGGVAAVPDSDGQFIYSTTLVASSLFKTGDTALMSLRHSAHRTADTSTMVLDVRYPIGNGLRLSPRLAISSRRDNVNDTRQLIAEPMLRGIYRWNRRYRVEAEVGGRWSSREIPLQTAIFFGDEGNRQDTSAYFFNLGYWVDF